MYERMVEPREVNRLQVVIREIHFRQTEHRREMCTHLNSQRAITLINDWQVLFIDEADFGKDTRDGQDALADVVSRRLAKAHRQLVQDCRRIDAKSSDDDIHVLRKDVKRIRYLAESFSEVVTPNNDESVLPRLLHLQDSLGEFQDLRIHETAIKDALVYLRPIYTSTTIEATEALLHQMKTRRQRLRKKVINRLLKY
jgi:CHAD domain-containing protein